jgi:hypothetical protein
MDLPNETSEFYKDEAIPLILFNEKEKSKLISSQSLKSKKKRRSSLIRLMNLSA